MIDKIGPKAFPNLSHLIHEQAQVGSPLWTENLD